jgi:catechol 2,3-dioxygenase-like lactoylglutathione lyase family enzyme
VTGGIFDDASMVTTILRVRDVAASVHWYRDKLGLEPVHVGADGPDHPIAVYAIAGAVVSLWQLPAGQERVRGDNDRNSYLCMIMNGDLESPRQALIERGVEVGEIRGSANNEFMWFHDLDGNRFELSRPLQGRAESALVARESREER